MRTRPLRIAAPLLAATLLLAACGSDDDTADRTSATTAASADVGATDASTAGGGSSEPGPSAPGTGADSTAAGSGSTAAGSATPAGASDTDVVVGAVLEPTSLDIVTKAGAALDQVLLDNVYETLLRADDQGEVGDGLVAMPEVSDDGLTLTFTVPDGVTFQNGDPLAAADIVWSLDAMRAEGASGAESLAVISSVEATDDHTVTVTLSGRDNDLLYQFTRREGAVLQADASDLANGAVGTGPFSFTEWNQGSSITLTRYDGYHGDPAVPATVTFQYFTDPNAAVNALTTGDVDLLTGVNTDLVGQFEDDPDYVVEQGTTNGEFTLGMNNSKAPFDDPAVRHAVRQAIDKAGILELYNGYGTIIGSPVPPTDPWYEDLTEIDPYDPTAAAAALREAGVPEGTKWTLTWPNIYPTNTAEYVASQLADVGIELEIVPVEFSVWLEQVYTNADYDLTAVLHVEPRDIANYANPDYYWRYDSPEVQQLIADAKTAATNDEYVDLLRQAARRIAEDAPVDWLILAADITVAAAGVSGYPTNDTASRFDASRITVEG